MVVLAKVKYGQVTSLNEWTKKFADLLKMALNSDITAEDVETVELGDEEACLVVKIDVD